MPPKFKVIVVVDSTVCLPQEVVEGAGLLVVPLEMVFEGATYRDGELAPAQFYQMLTEAQRLPTTSAPRPASFLQAFQEASQRAESILCLTLPPSLSATYDAARTAAEAISETLPGIPITLLDSQTAGPAQGFIALDAARAAQRGTDLEEVTQRAQALIPKVRLVAVLDTLYYLWKEGRVPKVGLWASSILSLKPILELSQGKVHLRGLSRTRQKATQRLLAILREAATSGPLHVNVVHTNAPAEAVDLRERIASMVPCAELLVSEMTTAMGVHTGPGLLGLAFYAAEPAVR